MSEWIDVPVADVQVGDEVKVDGFGASAAKWVEFHAHGFHRMAGRWENGNVEIVVEGHSVPVRIRRSSIVSARRRKPEPQPKPGDWRCESTTNQIYFLAGHYPFERAEARCPECRVYRASGGWSRDTRTGQPWVMRSGDPVELVIQASTNGFYEPLRRTNAAYEAPKGIRESFADYYKRIGLDVRPVDRRGKR